LALDRASGCEVWRCSLKGSDFVNIAILDGDLYASTKGEMFCLDPASGQIRWRNPLAGLGWGLVTIATPAGAGAVVMREKRRQEEQAAAAASAGA
jgi:hypothetical protein